MAAASRAHDKTVQQLLEAGADVNGRQGYALRQASRHNDLDVVELLLRFGAVPAAAVPEFTWPPVLMPCLRLHHVRGLPDDVKQMWVRANVKIRFRLARCLRHARAALDRPPATLLGTAQPTRDDLIGHLRTAGRRFAREYWQDGIPLFFPTLQARLGPVPDEFVFHRLDTEDLCD